MAKLTEAELAALAGAGPAALPNATAAETVGIEAAAERKSIVIGPRALELAAEKRRRVSASDMRAARGRMKAFF